MLSLAPARARAQKGPPRPVSLTFANSTVTCGDVFVGQATISEPVERNFYLRGIALDFSTSRPDLVGSNWGGVVAMEERTTSFSLPTNCWSVQTEPVDVVVTVTLNGASRTATVRVNPLVVRSVGLTRSGNTTYTGTVTLTGHSYSSDSVRVALTSSNPAIAKVPLTIPVERGLSRAQFTVTLPLLAFTTATPFTITASFRGGAASASETTVPAGTLAASATTTTTNRLAGVVPNVDASTAGNSTTSGVSLASFAIVPSSLMSGFPTQGQLVASGRVGPGGLAVSFRSADANRVTGNDLSFVRLPAIVTIPEGATSITFPIGTVFSEERRVLGISATGGGATQTAVLLLAPAGLSSFTIKTVFRDGRPVYTATMRAPIGHSGFSVAFASSRPDLVDVLVPVAFTPRDTLKSFDIATGPSRERLNVQITATVSLPGLISSVAMPSITATMLLYEPSIQSMTLSAPEVVGGSSTIITGTFTLNSPAPFNLPVSLIVNNPVNRGDSPLELVTAPTIAAGATTGQFAVRARAVTEPTTLTLYVQGAVPRDGNSATLRVTVRP
jgi:hypothetical protein